MGPTNDDEHSIARDAVVFCAAPRSDVPATQRALCTKLRTCIACHVLAIGLYINTFVEGGHLSGVALLKRMDKIWR